MGPHAVLKVTDATGKVLESFDPAAGRTQVISPELGYVMTDLLRGPVKLYLGDLGGKPVAGKSGTTEAYTGSIFIRYTPNLAIAASLMPRHSRLVGRFNRLGAARGFVYVVAGAAWVWLGQPPAPAWLLVLWFVAVGLVEAFIPGEANQVTLARASLAAPALAYSVSPGHLGLLAVVLAVAGLSDLVDGTVARRFERPSSFGGALDPLVDGILLGAGGMGLSLSGSFSFWVAPGTRARYVLPALGWVGVVSVH